MVLIGPRQVGKTTLALEIGRTRNALYFDLENPTDRSLLDDPFPLPESADDRLVILDEVHRTPGIFPVLRGVIDRGPREGKGVGRCLPLGSAALDISQQSGESLAGRAQYLTMAPLLATEVEADNLAHTSRHRTRPALRPANPLSEPISKSFGSRVPLRAMERLWTMLAHLHGGVLNTSELGRTMEADTRSIGRYIDFLVDLMLVRRLRPFHANVGKRLVKSPKVYIRDSGMLHALLAIADHTRLLTHPKVGMSWEGFVIENLLAALPWLSRGYFYRTHAGAEIDLVIERPDLSLWAVEIKRGLVRPGRGFHIAREDLRPMRSFVVHSGNDRYPLGDGVEAISLPELMVDLSSA